MMQRETTLLPFKIDGTGNVQGLDTIYILVAESVRHSERVEMMQTSDMEVVCFPEWRDRAVRGMHLKIPRYLESKRFVSKCAGHAQVDKMGNRLLRCYRSL